ncbi:effector-associated domain EAD1-containing protein [Streptomyces sp. NPDC002888]|uniref:effector-associated domain EAD1-containing protein n=1 Tax=Streptomyces sp. NPDC002888 TaxID=3364668 RepID=UPI0036A56430
MEAFSAGDMQREGILGLLAELYPGTAETRLLLEPLGGSLSRVPDQAAPLVRWYQVCRLTEHGAFPFNLEKLLEAVLAEYPGATRLETFLARRRARGADDAGSAGALAEVAVGLPDPATVLFLMSGPLTEERLHLGTEFDEIQEAVAGPGVRRVDVRVRAAARNDVVVSALDAARPHVLHYAGHGSPNGHLLMEGPGGSMAPVHTSWLAQALAAVGGVHCLVLTSCHLGRDLEDFRSCTDFAIGATAPLRNRDARAFSRIFYEALRRGRPVPEAFTLGKAQVTMTAGKPQGLRIVRGRRGGGDLP